jgi:hypothetical protein
MSASSRLASILDGMTKGPWKTILPGYIAPLSERRKYRCVLLDPKTNEDTSALAPGNARGIVALRNAPWLALVQAAEAVTERPGVYDAGGSAWWDAHDRLAAALADLERSLETT